jgi:hypothetical protein
MNQNGSEMAKFINKNKTGYRIGDVFQYGYMPAPWIMEQRLHLFEFTTKYYRNSLATRYLQDCKKDGLLKNGFCVENKKIMYRVLKQNCPSLLNDTSEEEDVKTALVHLRIGDKLDFKNSNKFLKRHYISTEEYKPVSITLKKLGVSQITIMAGIHMLKNDRTRKNVDLNHSQKYLNRVQEIFEEQGCFVTTVSGDPDIDICRLFSSKITVFSLVSNFSKMILKIKKTQSPDYETTFFNKIAIGIEKDVKENI